MAIVAGDLLAVIACPACGGELATRGAHLRCNGCGRSFRAPGGIPDLAGEPDATAGAIRTFYSAAPFPGYPARESYTALRRRAERSEFARLLDRAIAPDAIVLEVGCGTGQMCLYLATGERVVVGTDVTRASLELAAEAARRFAVDRVRFVETDLRRAGLRAGAFDVVYCSGVLHHTPDPEASFSAIARLSRPGGFVVIGVYNAYARIPHRVRRAIAKLSRLRWVPLDPVLRDRATEAARREAWVRDQYAHPLEHRHTVGEVQRWFERSGVTYLRTYPSALLAEPPLHGAGLFEPAEDDWPFENLLSQLSWAWKLGPEGGLFVAVGQKQRS